MDFSIKDSCRSVLDVEITAYSNVSVADTYLYLIAGVHGDEPEGVYVLEHLFAWLKNQYFDIPMIVIPVLNTDGFQAKTRVNANQVDLNRNFPTSDWVSTFEQAKYNPGPGPLSEPENVFLLKLFNQFPPNLIISFHSWKRMLNINAKAKDIGNFLAKFNNYPVTDDISYPTPGSLGTYVDELMDCGIITYECPEISDQIRLHDIWLENEQGLKQLFSSTL